MVNAAFVVGYEMWITYSLTILTGEAANTEKKRVGELTFSNGWRKIIIHQYYNFFALTAIT